MPEGTPAVKAWGHPSLKTGTERFFLVSLAIKLHFLSKWANPMRFTQIPAALPGEASGCAYVKTTKDSHC